MHPGFLLRSSSVTPQPFHRVLLTTSDGPGLEAHIKTSGCRIYAQSYAGITYTTKSRSFHFLPATFGTMSHKAQDEMQGFNSRGVAR